MFDETNTVDVAQEVTQAAPPPVQQESSKEANLRYLRERAETAERRAAELENAYNQQLKAKQPIQEDDFNLDDDSYIEGKHLKKYVNSLKKELHESKRQFEEITQKAQLNTAHLQLKTQYKDFDSVVSQENLERLARTKPHLHRSIMANPDVYERGATAYDMIMSSGVYDVRADQADKRIEENKNKPRSSATLAPQAGETPLTKVGEYDRRVLSKDQKEQLLRQMEEAKRNRV